MALVVDVRHRLGAFTLAASFQVERGLAALFGRSGSGKTSIVNVIAGLVRPDEGRVVIDGETVVETRAGVFVPPHRRRIGYVFQEARLFPHLTVRQNLLYGRWFAGTGGAGRQEVDHVVELLAIGHLLGRWPRHLSGGERQRVAIGRALLAAPRLLLMDEPLAALDEGLKGDLLPFLERLRDETRVPIVYVSHSVPEVARLADTVVLVSDGRIAAQGPVADVLGRLDLFPMTGRSEAGALIEAVVEAHDTGYGIATLRSRAGLWRVASLEVPVGASVRLRVRSRDVMLARSRPDDVSALNVLAARVAEIRVADGPIVEMRLDCGGDVLLARLTRFSVDRLGIAAGSEVFALVKAVSLDRRAVSAHAPRRLPDAGDA